MEEIDNPKCNYGKSHGGETYCNKWCTILRRDQLTMDYFDKLDNGSLKK
jgi:hypothetical protein